MAIIHQESKFNAKAKPPRKKLLWVIPWKRPSSSYGYSQALKQTWENYKKDSGNSGADRDEFSDATDFIGWYSHQALKRCGIPKDNAYDLYLAYHEGFGGYKKGTYLRKGWLMNVAKKVNARANTYHRQLQACQNKLPKKPLWRKLLMM